MRLMKRLMRTLAAGLVATVMATPVVAQDPLPLEVKINILRNLQPTHTEGQVGPFFEAVLKGGPEVVAPKGGITVRMSWLLTATGRTGHSHNRGAVPITIPEGEKTSSTFVAGFPAALIPDDGAFYHCNKMFVFLESLNPNRYRIAPNVKGEGYDYVVYADASPGMQSPGCR